MLAKILTALNIGLEVHKIEVEVDISRGNLPRFSIVGLPDASVREAKERIRSAIRNSDITFPWQRIILVNLAPADIKKEGPADQEGEKKRKCQQIEDKMDMGPLPHPARGPGFCASFLFGFRRTGCHDTNEGFWVRARQRGHCFYLTNTIKTPDKHTDHGLKLPITIYA